jgi:hypothetical protein
MLGQTVNWDYQWGQIVGRAWADEEFKERLIADPVTVLAEYDLTPPAGVHVEVLEDPLWVPENTAEVLYLVLAEKPSNEELSEDDLCSVAGVEAASRCGCEWCHRCHHCYCGWCGGCHHPPRPDED